MVLASEHIRVSKRVKRKLERRRRVGESFNDVLERMLDEEVAGDFHDGFGRWSDAEAGRVYKKCRSTKSQRRPRMEEQFEDTK